MIKAMYVKDFEHFVDRRVRTTNLKSLISTRNSNAIVNAIFAVFWNENQSHTQVVDSYEGTRVEGHSLICYASFHNWENKTSINNINNTKIKTLVT